VIKKMFLSEQPSLREVGLCVSSWNDWSYVACDWPI